MIKKRITWLMERVTPKMLKDGIPPNLETRFDNYFKLEERFDKMEKLQLLTHSKKLSYLLRHNPEDLEMNKNGWVKIDNILNKLDISMNDLERIVDTNDKKRFSFDETLTYIRANQGHSLDVNVELKEIKLPKVDPTKVRKLNEGCDAEFNLFDVMNSISDYKLFRFLMIALGLIGWILFFIEYCS